MSLLKTLYFHCETCDLTGATIPCIAAISWGYSSNDVKTYIVSGAENKAEKFNGITKEDIQLRGTDIKTIMSKFASDLSGAKTICAFNLEKFNLPVLLKAAKGATCEEDIKKKETIDISNQVHCSMYIWMEKLLGRKVKKDAFKEKLKAIIECMEKQANSTTQGRIYLNVPYSEKEDAKALGARWDGDRKLWYAPYGEKSLIEKWVNSNSANDDYFRRLENIAAKQKRNNYRRT